MSSPPRGSAPPPGGEARAPSSGPAPSRVAPTLRGPAGTARLPEASQSPLVLKQAVRKPLEAVLRYLGEPAPPPQSVVSPTGRSLQGAWAGSPPTCRPACMLCSVWARGVGWAQPLHLSGTLSTPVVLLSPPLVAGWGLGRAGQGLPLGWARESVPLVRR